MSRSGQTPIVLASTSNTKPNTKEEEVVEKPHGLSLDLKFTDDEFQQTSISKIVNDEFVPLSDSSKTSETTDTNNGQTSSGDDSAAASEIDISGNPPASPSVNHSFPRFTPYSNAQTQSTVSTVSQYSWTTNQTNTANSQKQQTELSKPKQAQPPQAAHQFMLSKKPPAMDTATAANQLALSHRFKSGTNASLYNNKSINLQTDIVQNKKGPRLNYESEGLSAADVDAVLSQLEIRPDTLRDSSTDFRPVFSCVRPIVCHKSNTSFYAQCSTAKLGYCTWCRQLRRGNQKQGSICLNCGERLTAKYHRWYPHLVRLEPLEKTRTKSMYIRYKPVFERFGITWHNEKQFEFVIDHYMLMKIYLSTENFNISALHLERTYMIGVFAGREFNTGALARKLLREGSKLAMFRADFPDYYDFLRDERAAVAEQMNLRFFQGVFKCYFHAHYTNIEGWYDPSVIDRERIVKTFKELCNAILAHTALSNMNEKKVQNGKVCKMNGQNQPQIAPQQQQRSPQRNNNNNNQRQQQRMQQAPPQQSNNNNNGQNGRQQQGPQMNVNVNQQLQGMNHLNNLQNMIQNMGISPMNQINVNQMLNQLPAITPTSKMNGFQFNAPAYLPPLATTPRFAVTPRGTTPRFNMNNNVMNSAPLQIPTSLLKNTSGNAKKDEAKRTEKVSKKDENNAKMTTLDEKNALNVGATPFFLNADSVISPRGIGNGIHIQMPPHPQTFAFPPPPLPQSTNWLHPVPPVLNATTPTNGALNGQCMQQSHHINMSPMVQQQINMMNMKQCNNMNNINLNQAQIGSGFVNGRGSPIFTPTQSPQFRPFSH